MTAYHEDISDYGLCDVDIVLGQPTGRSNRPIVKNGINDVSVGCADVEIYEDHPHGEGQMLIERSAFDSSTGTSWLGMAIYR